MFELQDLTEIVVFMEHQDCRVQRMKLITSYKVILGTGEEVPNSRSQEWKSEPCGTPLFSDATKATGVCRSCAKGWKVDSNYPLDTEENRALVPHYFPMAAHSH